LIVEQQQTSVENDKKRRLGRMVRVLRRKKEVDETKAQPDPRISTGK
jgi:hypothetical protein